MVRFVSCMVYALCVYVCVAGNDGTEQNFESIIEKFDASDPFFPQSLSVALITFDSKMCNGALIQAPNGDKGHYVLTAASCFWNRNLDGYRTRSGDKRYHVSGGWKVKDVAKVKVQFGVTKSSSVAECGVADIRISEQWTINNFMFMNSDRENDFAVVVLDSKCQLGPQFVPFDAAGKRGFFHGITKPNQLIRAAYTPEKQLVAHLEQRTEGYPWLLRTYSTAAGGKQTPAKCEIGAPVWTAAHAKDKDRLYAMYVLQPSNSPGVHLSIKLHHRVGGRLDGYMWREEGLSPLREMLEVCSETTKDTDMCWSTCERHGQYPCWTNSAGTKKRGGRATRPCGKQKVQTLCGTPNEFVPRKAVKAGKDATSKMFGAKLGDAYDSYYMYSDQDQEIDDEDEELEQELDEELDEMMQEMFTAGYNKGAKQQYRYQY